MSGFFHHSLKVSIHSWSSYQEKPRKILKHEKCQKVSIHSWSSYQEKRQHGMAATGAEEFQSTPGLVTRRNPQLQSRLKVYSVFQSTPGLVTRRNAINTFNPLTIPCFNPLLVQLPGETKNPTTDYQGIYVSIHSWSSYQEKQLQQIPISFKALVSIHSWSSYQEKREKKEQIVSYSQFQSTPGLVTRRNDNRSLQQWRYSKFQSTPGLVTRRNQLCHHNASKTCRVSIHSWSSYQEKLMCSVRVPSTCEFQSTPGLVTRRNG